jgi:hypothetical protein
MKNNENVLEIPTGSSKLLVEVIEKFNTAYKADFKFLHSDDRDGVEFGIVEKCSKCSDNMVFMLGFFWGGKVTSLRSKGKIDW